ncbi:MAG: hypothetical protein IIU97_05800, partial [Bacteroidaceae bacterium]|nr:hypothetical protein [Bacteroidaceae bacterium]
SKSQPGQAVVARERGVFDISKIQIQKQITTPRLAQKTQQKVYLIFQRYKFKSKSQPTRRETSSAEWCI